MQTAAAVRDPRSRGRIFALTTLVVISVCVAVVRSARFAAAPDIVAFGVTFDLCVTIPAAYYLLVVRGGHARPFTIIPLFVACLFVARLVVPQPQQTMLRQLGMLEAPAEVVAVAALSIRARRALRGSPSSDFLDRYAVAVRGAFGDNRLADALVAETGILHFAVLGWRMPSPRGGITFHKRSGWGSIVACIVVMIVAESIGAHLLIQRWSTTAAWIWTALDIYAILWLLGDWQALRLRPSLVRDDTLHLRFGFRWSASIALADIASVTRLGAAAAEELRGRRDTLHLAILEPPSILIETRVPVDVEGLLGIRKHVSRIALLPDDEAALLESLPRTSPPS